MKYRIKITERDLKEMKRLVLIDHPREAAAFALAGVNQQKDALDVLVRRPIAIPKELFAIQQEYHLKVSPQAINGLISLCEQNKLGVVICHSHPSDIPYSPTDDHGEQRIIEVLRKFIPASAPTASLLIYPEGMRARIWLPGASRATPVSEIRVIGHTIRSIFLEEGVATTQRFDSEIFDRQILAFGEAGQSIISSTKVGVVGVGGTGSPTAEQLVRLGVQDLTLIDKDQFDKSNLTRVYGTFSTDMPKKKAKAPKKVALVAKHLNKINPKAKIYQLPDDVVRRDTARRLLDRDIIFLCTDNHWSRAIVNEITYQYLIPTINMGVRIDAKDKLIIGASGVVDMLRPDLPCLWCRQSLSADRIGAESLPPEQRHSRVREGYAQDVDSAAPSVVSLTTAISAHAITLFLHLLTGFMGEQGHVERLNYDILSGTVRRGSTNQMEKCICKKVRAYGDLKTLTAI